MFRRGLVIAALAFASRAFAQPTSDVPPVDQPPPPVVEKPAEVTAVDGAARNFEQAPEESHVVGSGILSGIGVGVSWIVRVIEAPFRGGIYLQARYQIATKVKDLLTNDAGTIGVYPDGSYETTFGLSYGARAFWKRAFDSTDEMAISAKTGGAFKIAAQYKLDAPRVAETPLYLRSRIRYEENINMYFAGIGNGPDTDGMNLAARASSEATRFSQKRFLASLGAGVDLGNHIKLGGTGIYNHRTFGAAEPGSGDPSIEQVYNTATLTGYNSGFDNLELSADLEYDSRDTKGPTTSGVLARGFFGGGSLVDSATYGHYGAEAAWFVEPFWPDRVLIFRGVVEGVIDRDDDIPFTELPRIGGATFLRGYHTDTFRDKIATVGTIEYHYPIHNNVSGALFIDAGKVGRTFDDVYGNGIKDNWHLGYGGGLMLHTAKSVVIRIDLAYGDGLNFYFVTDVLDAFRTREREL
ncbi:MAG TPA: BamA/TamA family outer membrane protein [Kofleriaceae bacterium]